MASQFLVERVKEQTLLIQSTHFVEVLITLQENILKGSENKRKNIVRLVLWTTDVHNEHLENALYVDMKIT